MTTPGSPLPTSFRTMLPDVVGRLRQFTAVFATNRSPGLRFLYGVTEGGSVAAGSTGSEVADGSTEGTSTVLVDVGGGIGVSDGGTSVGIGVSLGGMSVGSGSSPPCSLVTEPSTCASALYVGWKAGSASAASKDSNSASEAKRFNLYPSRRPRSTNPKNRSHCYPVSIVHSRSEGRKGPGTFGMVQMEPNAYPVFLRAPAMPLMLSKTGRKKSSTSPVSRNRRSSST